VAAQIAMCRYGLPGHARPRLITSTLGSAMVVDRGSGGRPDACLAEWGWRITSGRAPPNFAQRVRGYSALACIGQELAVTIEGRIG
jgi:hypothetical protein